ncbi:hypothetical protein HMI55_007096, partial [Coelomomyces lativittatus]
IPSTPFIPLSKRVKAIPSSTLNPSNKSHSASPISSNTPSPTYLTFPMTPSPYYPSSSTHPSPPPMLRHLLLHSAPSPLPTTFPSSLHSTSLAPTSTRNRSRIIFDVNHSLGLSDDPSSSPSTSPSLYPTHVSIPKNNASKQQPQWLNIQGTSDAFDKLGLDG